MTRAREERSLDLHRLDGSTVSAGCNGCPLLRQCGGYTRVGGGWSCMDACRTCKDDCDSVCLSKPNDFARSLMEVGGLDCHDPLHLVAPALNLPKYIPVVQNPLPTESNIDWIALPLNILMRFVQEGYEPKARSAQGLRDWLRVPSTTKIVLLGTGKDRHIERYWRWRRFHNAPEALGRLSFAAAVAPNFSIFLDDPRPQHLFNRKRALICAAEWSSHRMPSIVYLHAITATDWRFWEELLRRIPTARYVAKEFQTGLANQERGIRTIKEVARLQDTLQRDLHFLAVGAAKYRNLLDSHFRDWTIVDSVPYMKALKRRAARRIAHRVRWDPAINEDVSDLFFHNHSVYQSWLHPLQPGRER